MRSLIAIKLGSGRQLALRNPDTLKKSLPLICWPGMDARQSGRMDSERTIIELNIRHYRGLLTTEVDPAKRRTIATLLAEEEAKLANLNKKGTSGSRG
jgi:hypothetical protein